MDEKDQLTWLRDYAVDKVAKFIKEKESRHIEPAMAYMPELSMELMEDFKVVLNGLVKDEILSWHVNVNGMKMFEFKRK